MRNRRKTDQGKPANVRKRREGNKSSTNWHRTGMGMHTGVGSKGRCSVRGVQTDLKRRENASGKLKSY